MYRYRKERASGKGVTAGTLEEHLGLTGIKEIDVRQKEIPAEQFFLAHSHGEHASLAS
jgi:hypothetical protein